MTAATSPRRKRRAYAPRVPARQRRTELLDAALHLIVTKGHNATTMDAVAEQAGVTKPVVYGQFSGRADLLAALLRREQEAAMRQLLDALPEDLDKVSEGPDELLAQIVEGFLRAVRNAPDRWYCVVMPMPDMPAELHAAREQARGLALARAKDIGWWLVGAIETEIGPEDLDLELLAHTMVSLLEMAARLVLADPEHFHPERFVTALRAAFALIQRPSPRHREC